MTKQEFIQWLTRKYACREAVMWIKASRARSVYDLWRTVPQGAWLRWLLLTLGYSPTWTLSLTTATVMRSRYPWPVIRKALEKEQKRCAHQ